MIGILMKLAGNNAEWIFCTILSAATPWCLPLLIGNQEFVISWSWTWFADFLICGVLGIIGGALSVVAKPPPQKDFRQKVARILIAGAVSALCAGLLIQVLFPNHATNLAARSCACGLVGFFSYPLLIALANLSIKDIIAILLRKPLPPESLPSETDKDKGKEDDL